MALLGAVSGLTSSLNRLPGLNRPETPLAPSVLPGVQNTPETKPAQGFGDVFENLVSAVDGKQKEAQSVTRDVLLGKTDNLHQSMIAMQEAGVAFQLMVEVRNKVVESYQELMRMPV
ncbi:flagellar hook-basal body complex protein FliE [Nibricoccus sp. IMCC34717]|uniref:flagellar hook-basal body complex protein FliE n=1 Tax=Nibricoccus sp. IMCC34717 TaxID=3034021 RepID=UPI00384FEB01